MQIKPFETENYFAKYEFSTPHLLSVSDCESMSIGELLEAAESGWKEFSMQRLGYTESQGNHELRLAIAEEYERVSPDDVIILGSPIEGIYLVMQTILRPEDQVIVLVPAYDALINVAEHISRDVRRWPIKATAKGWQLDFPLLEHIISKDTRLFIVNFPHNPTGYLPDYQDLIRLIDIARQHGIWLYCDEMYRGLEYEAEARLPSAADLYERSIVLAGLSKSHGLPGLRSGWLITKDADLRSELINWKHYTSICPPAPSEYLALMALRAGRQIQDRNTAIIKSNLKQAEGFFARWGSFFHWRPPDAGSVALVGIDVPSAIEYCYTLAKDAGVLLLPSPFLGYDDHHVRFGFGRLSFPEALNHYEAHLKASL